jgi:peptidoglycan/LPS O-acetylase OafA/YrhL
MQLSGEPLHVLRQSGTELNILFVAVPLGILLALSLFLLVFPQAWLKMVGTADARRNHAMDGTRGILSLWVLTHHLNCMTAVLQPDSLWDPGPGAVRSLMTSAFFTAPFFALTGMLFAGGLLASGGKMSTLQFIRNRFFRLTPAYLVSLLFVFGAAMYMTGFTLREPLFELFKDVVRWSSFGLLARYDFNTAHVWTWHGMLWTLPFEISFYAVLPVLAFLQRRSGTPIALIGGLAVIGVFVEPYIFFTTGAVAAACLGWRHRLAPPFWLAASVAALILLGVTADYSTPLMQALFLLPILVAVALQLKPYSLLRWRALRFVGEMSYSIYILHFPVISILYNLVLDRHAIDALAFPTRVALLTGLGIGLIALSALSFIFIERPCIELGRRGTRHALAMRARITVWLDRRNALRSQG